MGGPVISLGPWGGSGGNTWSARATNGITTITINEETNIKTFSFTDANGVFSGTFGGRNPHSSGRGVERTVRINWPSEYLTSISGTYNGLQTVLSLTFITNLNTYGPFGSSNSGQAFTIPIADNVVVGFYGRSGYYLDAIGVHLQPMNPRGSVSVGPWGGSGGDSFGFKLDYGSLKKIIISHSETILSISFEDADDREYGPFGVENPYRTAVKSIIEIGNLERLTCISGTYGKYSEWTVITSLSFVVNNTNKGPYGTEPGASFNIAIEESEVIGFFGKSGLFVDAIGVYVKPVKPASNSDVELEENRSQLNREREVF